MRKIQYLRLKTGPYVPDVGNLNSILPDPNKTVKDFEMWDNGTEILIRCTAKNGKKVEAGLSKTEAQLWTYAVETNGSKAVVTANTNGGDPKLS